MRNGVWHYVRRVPVEYRQIDPRGIVKLSTKVKVAADRSGTKASRVAAKLDEKLELYWRGLAGGASIEARQAWQDAVARARTLDLEYLAPAEGAQRPISDVLTRLETLMEHDRWRQPAMRQAAGGLVERPALKLSTLFDDYAEAKRARLAKMSEDQQRKWKSAKRRAVEILIEHLEGDKALHELTRADMLGYTKVWEDRVIDEGLHPGTANKNITHIVGMIRTVNRVHQLHLDMAIFSDLRLEGGRNNSRKPFLVKHITGEILAPGALAALNDEARDALLVVVETGARPSEIVNLDPAGIVLDAEIPHIKIRPTGRLLKNEVSERDIPLVGMALDAMKRHPAGFPRYRDRGSQLSAVLMKHFKAHKLLPSDEHSIYSLRHSFKDRLKAVLAPEELIDETMGHAIDKPKYGDGYGLQLKRKFIQAIALTPSLAEVACKSR
ncbi:MAG: hypothetical protein J0H71_05340 [Rhizobiales bacterium]|nr:hypothetical protein [Hyphomicrobiales bacterium]